MQQEQQHTLYYENRKLLITKKDNNCNRKLGEFNQNNLKAETHQKMAMPTIFHILQKQKSSSTDQFIIILN